MYDIRNTIPKKIKRMSKDNDNSEFTIGECIDDVILFLENAEKQLKGKL
jgi:RNAse (barnase) inhibitor barstar